MGIKAQILKIPFIKNWKRNREKAKFKGSAHYWEDRYAARGNSGSGSYDHLANNKAEIINTFVKKNNIQTILEFGCGDGNQLKIADYPNYIGLDVSKTAIQLCISQFKNDHNKSFLLYDSMAFQDNHQIIKADLSMSLDVLYHLVEKTIFEKYLRDLFNSSKKHVLIYASDFNQDEEPVHQHENRRSFTQFVNKNFPQFKLTQVIKSPFPVSEYKDKGTLSDYYFYERI
jgi:cyclopropane fatty-acyl-phospholipid synthase-like methyltransferase